MSGDHLLPSPSSSSSSHQQKPTCKTNGTAEGSRTSLIINYLPQNVKEPEFIEMFSALGEIKSAKLMYERETGYSFGYGFVEYVNADDAQKAIDTYNGYSMEHKRLKVAYSRPNTAETRNTTLYFRNVPDCYDDSSLCALVQPYGSVVQARVIVDKQTNKCRGIGFVIMATKGEANKVAENLDGKVAEGGSQPLIIKPTDQNYSRRNQIKHRSGPYEPRGSPMSMKRPLLNSGGGGAGAAGSYPTMMPATATASAAAGQYAAPYSPYPQPLQQQQQQPYPPQVSEWGYDQQQHPTMPPYHPQDYSLMQQQQQYSDPSMYQQMYAAYMQQPSMENPYGMSYDPSAGGGYGYAGAYESYDMYAQRSSVGKRPRTAGDDERLIYIYGLRPTASDQEVYQLFAPFGQIERVDLIMDHRTGKAKGYAFVLMQTLEQAQSAITALNGHSYNGKLLQVRFRGQGKPE